MTEKSSSGLSVVGTPIGNLGDLSVRAREVLRDAEWLLCEDTRQALKLFHSVGIEPPTRVERCDAHATEAQLKSWATELAEGGRRAVYISDAGTPGVSDPVAALVRACREKGVPVFGVPGPSALATFLSISGFQANTSVFHGFFPRENADRSKWWESSRESEAGRVHVFFESPHRIESSLDWMAEHLPQAQLVLAKELTKLFERHWAGECESVRDQLRSDSHLDSHLFKGEWVFGLCWDQPKRESGFFSGSEEKETLSPELIQACEVLIQKGVKSSQVAKFLAQNLGLDRNTLYRQFRFRSE
jgi:16S rRNA (cytidine1402-2'-O)-methyltransferase